MGCCCSHESPRPAVYANDLSGPLTHDDFLKALQPNLKTQDQIKAPARLLLSDPLREMRVLILGTDLLWSEDERPETWYSIGDNPSGKWELNARGKWRLTHANGYFEQTARHQWTEFQKGKVFCVFNVIQA